jgi:hypothetical protein
MRFAERMYGTPNGSLARIEYGVPNGTKLREIMVKRAAYLSAKTAKFTIKRHLA